MQNEPGETALYPLSCLLHLSSRAACTHSGCAQSVRAQSVRAQSVRAQSVRSVVGLGLVGAFWVPWAVVVLVLCAAASLTFGLGVAQGESLPPATITWAAWIYRITVIPS